MSGFVWSTPPIEYAVLLMFVCGGASTCFSVWDGVRKVARKCRNCAGRHLANAPKLRPRPPPPPWLKPPPPPAPPPPAPPRTAGRAAALLGADLREARLDLRQLRRRRRCRRPGDGLLLPARLERRHDLRHRALLVLGEEQQAARHLRHAGERGDPRRLRLREGQLRAGEEEVVNEVLARLAELRQVGEHGLVRLDHRARVAAAAGTAAGEAALLLLRRERDRQIGADARQRVQRGLLRLVEPARQRHDRDHEPDADARARAR